MSDSGLFAELPRFPTTVEPPSQAGALVPVLNSGDLMLESPISDQLDYQFGGNIGALLIFDIDVSHVVGSVELLVPKSRWEPTDLAIEVPSCPLGTLVVPPTAGREVFVDTEVEFLWDRGRSRLHVEIEPTTVNTLWVSLSEGCFALINESFLAGFFVSF